MSQTIISSDSHVTEHPEAYTSRVAKKYRDRVPHLIYDEKFGDLIAMEGLKKPIALSIASSAGENPKDLLTRRGKDATFEVLPKGGWDPASRIEAQKRDGISAEILYPTVGMEVCNLKDPELKKVSMDAYNAWLAEFTSGAPGRLFGLGQTPMRDIDESIADLEKIKAMGMVGVNLPGRPAIPDHDYDSEIYDPFWQACIDLGLPPSFHILTSGDGVAVANTRGHKLNAFMGIIRANQDIVGMLILGAVFDRNPDLKVVCVEADAGWAPHYMHRMDHGYEYHRYWMRAMPLERKPSEYFLDNICLTFQNDRPALLNKDHLNIRNLLWANDYPHPDSTWPDSQGVIDEHMAHLSDDERAWVLHDNTSQLYSLPPIAA
jgi:predicted TIM-barrel fold metal-dependent hydrolase